MTNLWLGLRLLIVNTPAGPTPSNDQLPLRRACAQAQYLPSEIRILGLHLPPMISLSLASESDTTTLRPVRASYRKV